MSSVTRLDNFGFLAVTGKDACDFLQGYSTCDMTDITPDVSGIGALCNLKGRMVTSFRIAGIEDGYLMRMDRELVAATMDFLKKYIVFSKAEMTDWSDRMRCYGIIGGTNDFPPETRAHAIVDGSHVINVASDRYELWSEQDTCPVAADPLEEADWWKAEVADGLAWVTTATTEQFIPQMFDYHNIGGIDFDKGCYLGQEIVARMQHRGQLNRKLHRGKAEGRQVEVGTDIQNLDGQDIGMVVASAGEDFLAVIQAKGEATPACYLERDKHVDIEPVQR